MLRVLFLRKDTSIDCCIYHRTPQHELFENFLHPLQNRNWHLVLDPVLLGAQTLTEQPVCNGGNTRTLREREGGHFKPKTLADKTPSTPKLTTYTFVYTFHWSFLFGIRTEVCNREEAEARRHKVKLKKFKRTLKLYSRAIMGFFFTVKSEWKMLLKLFRLWCDANEETAEQTVSNLAHWWVTAAFQWQNLNLSCQHVCETDLLAHYREWMCLYT